MILHCGRIVLMDNNPSKSIKSLLLAQFFGAFNDNAWKMIVALLAIRAATEGISADTAYFETVSQTQTMYAFVIFTLPLMLFSLPAGLLSDRVSKRSVIIWMKISEVVLLALGTWSLTTDNIIYPLIVLALLGTQSALFSPAKYGIIPELLDHKYLSKGNGLLEMWTFVAIILGTAAGGALIDATGSSLWMAAAILGVFSIIGLFASFKIPQVPVARKDGGFGKTLKGSWQVIVSDRVLWLAVLGSGLFWGVASLLGQNILVYTKALTAGMQSSDTLSGLPLAFYGLGVGIGSMLAGKISGRLVEYGLIPLGAIGVGVLTMAFGLIAPELNAVMFLMTLMGISSGFIVVPLNSILQWRSPTTKRGGVIALSNVFVFGCIMLGSLVAGGLSIAGMSPGGILIFASIITMAGMTWAIYLLPDFLIRLVFVLLTLTFYKLTVEGQDKIPTEGGALLVPNHVSFIDGFLVMASTDRPVRFIVDEIYYNKPFLKPFMKSMRAIPVSATGGMRVILRALRDAGNFLDEGELVCIFAEGQITRTGMMLPFRRGLERIVKGRNASVIPVHLDRVWGSIYSRSGGRFLTKLPERFPYPITITYGEPMPSSSRVNEIRRAVQELETKAWEHRKKEFRPLHHYFIRKMRSKRLKMVFADSMGTKLSRLKTLAGVISMAKRLQSVWQDDERIGIMVPPSIGGAFANLAAAIAGKVTVNINFTAGKSGMNSAVKQAELKHILTSKQFLEKANIEPPEGVEIVFLEDIKSSLKATHKLFGLFAALFMPIRMIESFCGCRSKPSPDDAVTIIFSSGSTGDPKGVVLTHQNIMSNVEGVGQVITVNDKDRLLGILPLFHSFGYMSLWYAMRYGMSLIFHPNPLDAGKIGEIAEDFGITFLIATPTFLQIYMRRCTPGQFGSLRIAFTGAEKLPDRLAVAFEEKFGIKPIEGYGATECAPAITVSTIDFRSKGIYQFGSRRGYVGHPVPGVSVRIVDPDSFEILGPGQPGMLLVKGPNVMQGYLNRPDLTEKAIKDGWYITGDIAILDDSGFVKITDRLSRFSKIGGEMIPHGKVEEALHEALGSEIKVFAVTSVTDDRKGESLAVVHTIDEQKIPEILEKLPSMGLPNLFIPRKDKFVKVEAIPVLGTGKVDLRALKQVAADKLKK